MAEEALPPRSASAIAQALGCGRSGCPCVQAARIGHGMTHCPGHSDTKPSLSLSNGRVDPVVHCHTGCSQETVIAALTARGLWETSRNGTTPHEEKHRYAYETHLGPAYHVRIDQPGKDKIMWWERADGTRKLPEGIGIPDLPLYRIDEIALRPDEPVLVMEGEKKTDAAIAAGFVAVSVPGGASQKQFGQALLALHGRDCILVPDNDPAGRQLMMLLSVKLATVARSVRSVELPGVPSKGDFVDYLGAGGTAEAIRQLIQAPGPGANGRRVPQPRKARDLQIAGLPEIGFAVGTILPEGVTLCAGRPKQGKSFLALNLAIAVACGGKALGDLPVQQGDVLYLTLEGGEHGFLPRLNTMLRGGLAPDALEYETEWPRLDDGGADMIASWLGQHPNAKLIVVDTLAKVRPPTNNKSGVYEQDYQAVQSLVKLALDHHVAILLIHHTRKAIADDPLDTVSGSTGLTGSVDAVWVLQRVRGQGNATLTVSGRNIADNDLGLEWDDALLSWRHAGEAADVRRSAERQSVLSVFREDNGGPLTAQEVADLLERDFTAIRQTMYRMARSGELVSCGRAGYRLASTSNEGSHASRQSPVSQVSQVSHIDESAETSATYATCDTHAPAGARASIADSPDDPVALCPNGCGIDLRDGRCPLCRYPEQEESP